MPTKYHRTSDVLGYGYARNRTQLVRLITQGLFPPPTYIGSIPMWTDGDLDAVDARLRAERDARPTPIKQRPCRRRALAVDGTGSEPAVVAVQASATGGSCGDAA